MFTPFLGLTVFYIRFYPLNPPFPRSIAFGLIPLWRGQDLVYFSVFKPPVFLDEPETVPTSDQCS